ncbi:CsbD family protein [Novosphingobium capsulatum]|uniref:CsbD family protein n=1 Tax=Novosphingobium capsulatum TaxID=13688 RepID=UPI000786B7CF|nr:CsbD family protein [Novosphingobium capsulatum]WQD95040.1 CsbD family protein [Novosphingobium capsulatum]
MNEHRISGAIKEAAGTIEQGIGTVTGDDATRLRGQSRRIEGRVEGLVGKTIDRAIDRAVVLIERGEQLVRNHPRTSAIVAGVVALSLGRRLSAATRG